jgi:hypothetical protein
MLHELLPNEETNAAALVLALSGTILVLVSRGNGPPSPDQVLSRVLSNPIPRRVPRGTESTGSLSVPLTAMAA